VKSLENDSTQQPHSSVTSFPHSCGGTHWEAFCPRLEAEGGDVKEAPAQGQLTVVDAGELLPRFMDEKVPEAPVFLGLAGEVVARAGTEPLSESSLVG
jgi:hypothetical protein